MKYKISVPNSIFADQVTTLMVCVLIDGKEILQHALRNEDVVKGVLMSWTHVEVYMLSMRLHFLLLILHVY